MSEKNVKRAADVWCIADTIIEWEPLATEAANLAYLCASSARELSHLETSCKRVRAKPALIDALRGLYKAAESARLEADAIARSGKKELARINPHGVTGELASECDTALNEAIKSVKSMEFRLREAERDAKQCARILNQVEKGNTDG